MKGSDTFCLFVRYDIYWSRSPIHFVQATKLRKMLASFEGGNFSVLSLFQIFTYTVQFS